MTVPRWLAASAVAAGLAVGSAGIVMAANSSPSSSNFDDAPRTEASPDPSPSESAFPDPSPSPSIDDSIPVQVLDDVATISQQDAVAVALAAVGGAGDQGQLERAVLKFEDGRLVWDVRFSSDSKVEVDALTGNAVKVDTRSGGSGGSGASGSSHEPGDDNGGNRGSGSSHEPGDDNGGNRGSGSSHEPGDDNGGNRGSGSSHEPGDDNGGNRGRYGSDD